MKCNVHESELLLSLVHCFLLWLYSWQFNMTRCKGRALFCNQVNVVFNDLYWELPVVFSVVLMQCLTHIPFLNHSHGLPRFQKNVPERFQIKIFQLS